MKKTTLTIVMAMLCLNFSSNAQDNKAIDLTTKGIQVGQQVPDHTINNIHNYKTTTAKLSDFKGKLVIIDFWATWCSPCVDMIPKMDSLQKVFGDKIQFISASYESENKVLPFLKKLQKGQPSNLLVIAGDTILHQLFPHKVMPHYVWIDGNGILLSITDSEEVTYDHISKFLQNQQLKLVQKKDLSIPFDETKPMLIASNGGNGDNLVYHSLLTRYTEGMGGKFYLNTTDASINPKVMLTNASITWLFKLAYGTGTDKFFSGKKVSYEVADRDKLTSNLTGDTYTDWMKQGNAYCYELILPGNLRDNFYTIFQDDLKRMFGQYSAIVELRKIKCLALVRTSAKDKIRTQNKMATPEIRLERFGLKMQNASVSKYVTRLEIMFNKKTSLPLIDQTGYVNAVDIELNCDQTDLPAINEALTKYDLKWVERYSEVEILVIRDTRNPKSTQL